MFDICVVLAFNQCFHPTSYGWNISVARAVALLVLIGVTSAGKSALSDFVATTEYDSYLGCFPEYIFHATIINWSIALERQVNWWSASTIEVIRRIEFVHLH